MTEQDSQSSAVLRREAEQLLRDVGAACVDTRKRSDIAACAHCSAQVDKIEAFARRQRAQALTEAADEVHLNRYPTMFVDAWLRARAAAEGTGGGE